MQGIKLLNIAFAAFLTLALGFHNEVSAEIYKPSKNNKLDDEKIKQYEKGIDSLLSARTVRYQMDTTNLAIDFLGDDTTIHSDIPDSVFIKRLAKLPSLIDLPYNNVVRASILWYIIRRKNVAEKILGLRNYYFPIFEQTLDKYNLPIELRYLPIIESALNPVAVSHVGATGLWQFMYGTGKQYNLNITSFVDERRDPIMASEAAAKFLKDLYKIYQDWTLVIAAYNCGPRNVNKAIRRAGGSKNYWAIYNYLPKETRGYVPNFIAAAYLVNYYKEHNLEVRNIDFPRTTDTIHVNRMLHFQQIADVLPISVDELRELNPQYKKDIIPGIEKTYTLVLPMGSTAQFVAKENEIYSRDSIYFIQNNFPQLMASNEKGSTELGTKTINHKVHKGETISSIAKKYDVDVAAIKEWNKGKIKKGKLTAGHIIKIYQSAPLLLAAKETTKVANVQALPAADSSASKGQVVLESNTEEKTAQVNSDESTKVGKTVYYHVKRNDTLWKIAKKFDGISAKDIQEQNNISTAKDLKVGLRLKITLN